MLFSSTVFLWKFLPITLVSCFFLKTKWSNYILLIASLLFYAWGEPIYVLLMLFSIALNYSFGILIDKSKSHRKFLLTVCVIANLLILGYFKYYNFFVDTINRLVGATVFIGREIALPVGISFFTFQALSYVIDLYRGDCKVQTNILNLALYVSFFPQLIAGPIVRYSDIDEQIKSRSVTAEKFAKGMRRFLYGLGKKVIISNCMAELADRVFGTPFAALTTGNAWLGAIAYTLQIYYDFSGYSDMAIGLGKIFGFDFLENFNYPYVSRSIQEFWQRWHISLGSWFREYVYIPLGGNRKGKARTYINLIIVFFLTGMWHGASWSFIIWGLYHGAFQIIERLGLKRILNKHPVFSHVYAVVIVIFGWVFFRCERLLDSLRFIHRMLAPWKYAAASVPGVYGELTSRYGVCIVLAVLGSGLIQKVFEKTKLADGYRNSAIELGWLCLVFAYCMVLLAAGTYNPFIYFRF